MHKVLQAIIDTFLLAAGSVELSSTMHSPSHASQHVHRRSATRPSSDHELPTERANRPDSQSFAGKRALQPRAEESRL